VPPYRATPCQIAVGAYLPSHSVPYCSRCLLTELHRVRLQSVPTYRATPCQIAVGAYLPSYTVSYSRSNNLLVACHMEHLEKCWRVCGIFNTVQPVLSGTWGIMEICLQRKTFIFPRIWSSKDQNFQCLYETQPASNGKKILVRCSSVRCRWGVLYCRACGTTCKNLTRPGTQYRLLLQDCKHTGFVTCV
jgi:hypothetical protein